MRIKVVPRASRSLDAELVPVVGAKQPAEPLTGAPAKLRALVAAAGEGLLCGELWLFAASPRQRVATQALTARLDETGDAVAWLPLRRADRSTWTLVGDFVGGRGALVWDALRGALRCFAANGRWLDVGADLPELLTFLGERRLFGELLGPHEPGDEELGRRAPLNYLVTTEPPGAAFASALERGDAQPAFAALLDLLPSPDGVLVAREVLRRHPSVEWGEHLALVLKRSQLCAALVAAREATWPPVLAQLRAAGFEGDRVVADQRLAALEASHVRTSLVDLRQKAGEPSWPTVFVERMRDLSPLEAVAAEVTAESFPRLWPLTLLLRDVGAQRPLADAAYVASLDAWLLCERYAEAFALAKVRVASAPLDEAHFALLMDQARRPGAASGAWALLATQASRTGVMALFCDLARAGPDHGPVNALLDAAQVHGAGPSVLEALGLVYSRPKVWDEYERADAALLAADLGDERAREVVRRRQSALARNIDRM